MLPDSKNPFAAAAAPSNGSAPSPFQSAATNGSAASNGAPAPSPFEAAAPVASASIPEAKKPAESPSSPFALVEDAGASLVEPTEGFAARQTTPPAPVAMPSAPPATMNGSKNDGESRNDPFAAPAPGGPSQAPQRRGDFVLPAENGQSASRPVPAAVAQPAPGQTTPAAATPAVVAAVTGETSQLVLRAIFGVTRELDRNEILQRARTLPGIRNLQVVGGTEASAMATLRESILRMGFGDQASLALTTSGGVVDIIEESGTILAVLHEGGYAAGVRETLIIVARELSRLHWLIRC